MCEWGDQTEQKWRIRSSEKENDDPWQLTRDVDRELLSGSALSLTIMGGWLFCKV